LKTILDKLGWNSSFEAEAARRSGSRSLKPARVLERTKDSWTIALAADDKLEERTARASGGFLRSCQGPALPVTGDWVLVRALGKDGALIEAVLPRRTRISRKAKGETGRDKVEEQVLVANVDLVVIIAAAGLDWNARRIERYLALAHDSGAKAAVVVTKADLAAEPETLLKETKAIAPGVEVLALSALSGYGMEEFAALLEPGKTAVLIGSSGSGKSTLLNRLAGNPIQAVQDVREDDHKGRHTTSSRSLFILPSGALLIDTPGLREVQLWTDKGDVDAAFPEIEALAARCRFRDCSHGDEPGCALRQALKEGLIDEDRFEAWRKLRLELSLLRLRGGPASPKAVRNQSIKRERKFKARLRNEED
jgi:ribosome biogenesis GTPase / thiamine phosphate phosphatase